jgi:hypothetical protein
MFISYESFIGVADQNRNMHPKQNHVKDYIKNIHISDYIK